MPKYLLLDLKDGYRIDHAWKFDSSNLNLRTGSNTGNFAFRYSILNFLIADDSEIQIGGFDSLENTAGYDAVILACSNWIGTNATHERINRSRMESLLKIDIPVLAIGLGTQMHYEQSAADLGEFTSGLLKVLCEKSLSISVRDEFTFNLLTGYGFANIYATGCPSNFICPNINLGVDLCNKLKVIVESIGGWFDLLTAIQEYGGKNAYSSNVFSQHYNFLSTYPSQYFVQDFPLISSLLTFPFDLPNEYSQKLFPGISGVDAHAYKRMIRECSIYFTDFSSWMSHLRKFDISFGMRLHGNMAALQAGVPSIVIAHDLRTKELTKLMSIPSIDPLDFINMDLSSPDTIAKYMLLAYGEYDSTRSNLAFRMIDCLKYSKIPPSKQLILIASQNLNQHVGDL